MSRDALCDFIGFRPSSDLESLYPKSGHLQPEPASEDQESVLSVLLQAFDILKADANLRAITEISPDKVAASFERLRTKHPLRPEFRHFIVDLDKRHINLAGTFAALGFQLEGAKHFSPI